MISIIGFMGTKWDCVIKIVKIDCNLRYICTKFYSNQIIEKKCSLQNNSKNYDCINRWNIYISSVCLHCINGTFSQAIREYVLLWRGCSRRISQWDVELDWICHFSVIKCKVWRVVWCVVYHISRESVTFVFMGCLVSSLGS